MGQERGDPVRVDARLVGFLATVVVIATVVHLAADAHYDFGVFYYAARMVWDGARTSLYDLGAQRVFQVRYARPPDLIFCSPPFALVPYLPFAVLPMQFAFVLWTIASVVLLTVSVKCLALRVGLRNGNWPVLLSVAFMPVATGLTHGQLSIVVLAAYVWCYTLWRDGRRFSGGAVLALTTVKFQLVAGFVCVLLLKRRWKELEGFGLGCVPLLILSGLLEGWRGLLNYPALLVHEETTTGVLPNQMASLRGLLTLLGVHGNHGVVVAILSVGVLALAAAAWKNLDSGFAAALLASMLVSYHFNPQDLSLALVPLFLCTKHVSHSAVERIVGTAIVVPTVLWFAGCFSLLAVTLILMIPWVRSWRPQVREGLTRLEAEAVDNFLQNAEPEG